MKDEEINQTLREIKERHLSALKIWGRDTFLIGGPDRHSLGDVERLLSIVKALSDKLAEQEKNFCPDRIEVRRRLIEEIGIFNEDNFEAVEYAVLVVIEYCERYGKDQGK